MRANLEHVHVLLNTIDLAGVGYLRAYGHAQVVAARPQPPERVEAVAVGSLKFSRRAAGTSEDGRTCGAHLTCDCVKHRLTFNNTGTGDASDVGAADLDLRNAALLANVYHRIFGAKFATGSLKGFMTGTTSSTPTKLAKWFRSITVSSPMTPMTVRNWPRAIWAVQPNCSTSVITQL